jgi:photosystem II stability/assembly factor-like uncharacterized protein
MNKVIQLLLVATFALLMQQAGAFEDPLNAPALPSQKIASSPTLAIERAGDHFVAAGRRGHIMVSDTVGQKWTQATVPVSVDLVALSFPNPLKGWAVGHDGVILHTVDGGYTWTKQADGYSLSKIAHDFYQSKVQAGEKSLETFLDRAKALVNDGADKPFLTVWFQSEKVGYVAGAFNMLFKTSDGGKSWEPWMHRIDNPGEMHLYSIKGNESGVYIAGEQALLVRMKSGESTFKSMPKPTYKGSYFGLLINPKSVVIHGMRGNAFLSNDQGNSWKKLNISTTAGLTTGLIGSSNQIYLASVAGEIFVSMDQGRTFQKRKPKKPMSYFGMAEFNKDAYLMTGYTGVRLED